MEQEEWRIIPGHIGFEASSYGRIRSFIRKKEGKILNQFLRGDKKKYLSVNISRPTQSGHTTHSLIAKAFIGPRPDGLVVDHIDNDSNNNHADNLQYITSQENNTKDRDESNYTRKNNRFVKKSVSA